MKKVAVWGCICRISLEDCEGYERSTNPLLNRAAEPSMSKLCLCLILPNRSVRCA